MAKVLAVNYRPRRLADVIAIIFMLGILALVFFVADSPSYLKVLVAIASLLVIGGALQSLIYGPRLSRALKRLSESVKVEEERLVFPRPLKLKPGTLTISYHRAETGYSYYTRLSFKESGGGEAVKDSLKPEDFKGEVGILAGLPWEVALDTGSSTALPASRESREPPAVVWDAYEWIVAPAYEIVDDPEYNTPGGSIIVAYIPRVRHEIALAKSVLSVRGGGAMGIAEVKVEGGVIKGVLTYTKQPGARAREVRLEFEAFRKGIKHRVTLARLESSGRISFKWSLGLEEDVYLLIPSQAKTRPGEVLRRLSTGPLLAGIAWRDVDRARLKLVLNVPLARDLLDEAWVRVEPGGVE